jgi:hypothetical protein
VKKVILRFFKAISGRMPAITAFTVLIGFLHPVLAAESQVILTAGAGVLRGQGAVVRPGWMPVMARIENRGPALNADLVAVNSSGTFHARKAIFVAAGDVKTFWLYVLVGNYTRKEKEEIADTRVSVSVVKDDAVVVSRDAQFVLSTMSGGTTSSYNVLLFASKEGREDSLGAIRGETMDYNDRTYIHITKPQPLSKGEKIELPDSEIGYESVDLIVFNEFNFDDLKHESRRAIRRWILSGGKVLFSPGSAAWLKSNFITDLVPIGDNNVKVVPGLKNIPKLEEEFNSRLDGTKEFDVIFPAGVEDMQAINEIREPECANLVIFSGAPAGFGTAFFLALDVGKDPWRRWPGFLPMWRDLMERADRSIFGRQKENRAGDGRLDAEMCEMVSGTAKLPPIGLVSALIIFYLVLVGPVNYYVLKLFDKQALIVFTVPLIAAFYLGVIFTAGYISKGTSNVVRKFTTIEMKGGLPLARVNSHFSVYASSAGRYRVESAPSAAIYETYKAESARSAGSVVVRQDQDAGFTVADHFIGLWSIAFFSTSSFEELRGGFSVKAEEGSRLCEVANGTPYAVARGYAKVGNAYYSFGAIPAGGKASSDESSSALSMFDLGRFLFGRGEESFDMKSLQTAGISETDFEFIGVLETDPAAFKLDEDYTIDKGATLVVVRDDPMRGK